MIPKLMATITVTIVKVGRRNGTPFVEDMTNYD